MTPALHAAWDDMPRPGAIPDGIPTRVALLRRERRHHVNHDTRGSWAGPWTRGRTGARRDDRGAGRRDIVAKHGAPSLRCRPGAWHTATEDTTMGAAATTIEQGKDVSEAEMKAAFK